MPLVSIGMPTYNGARFLREALDALLGQDSSDFELIISDNASTDDTESICREYAARDGRIRYHRSPENRGAAWNFNRVLELASGPYFLWAADDDLRAPSYLSECLSVLERDPQVVVAHSQVVRIDERGTVIDVETGDLAAESPSVRRRLRTVLRYGWWTYVFYGLIRTDVLRTTRGYQPYYGSDTGLVVELALRGRIAQIRKPLFQYRVKWSAVALVDYAAATYASLAPPNRHRRFVPYRLLLGLEHRRDVWRAPRPLPTRIALLADLAWGFTWHWGTIDEARRIASEALGPARTERLRCAARRVRRALRVRPSRPTERERSACS